MKIDLQLRDGVIAIARAAATAILEIYDSEFAVEHKDDRSPLTAADLAAHRCIVDGLERLTPDIPVLSEESSGITTAQRRSWPRMWLVDPLDGTREFVKRNGEFTVNIALIEDGVSTFGVVQAPVTGVAWHGGRGIGAFRQDGAGVEQPLRVRAPATAPLRVAASRSHRDQRTATFIERMGEVEPVGLGSSLKFCRIAEGRIDVYPRFGPTSEWDTAAAQCVLEEAGGAVLRLDGTPLDYGRKDDILNPYFIALGDPSLPWRDWLGGRTDG